MPTLQYYDVVLAGVIAPLLVAVLLGYLTTLPTIGLVIALGGASVVVMGYALFVVGPVEDLGDLTEEVEELPGPADDLLK